MSALTAQALGHHHAGLLCLLLQFALLALLILAGFLLFGCFLVSVAGLALQLLVDGLVDFVAGLAGASFSPTTLQPVRKVANRASARTKAKSRFFTGRLLV